MRLGRRPPASGHLLQQGSRRDVAQRPLQQGRSWCEGARRGAHCGTAEVAVVRAASSEERQILAAPGLVVADALVLHGPCAAARPRAAVVGAPRVRPHRAASRVDDAIRRRADVRGCGGARHGGDDEQGERQQRRVAPRARRARLLVLPPGPADALGCHGIRLASGVVGSHPGHPRAARVAMPVPERRYPGSDRTNEAVPPT